MSFTIQELAYAAGIVDGEGCIGVRSIVRSPRHVRIVVEVANTDARLVRWLEEPWPPSKKIRPMVRKTRYSAKHKPLFLWMLTSRKAEAFLSDVLPYLLIKKDQAELALAAQATIKVVTNKVPDNVVALRAE